MKKTWWIFGIGSLIAAWFLCKKSKLILGKKLMPPLPDTIKAKILTQLKPFGIVRHWRSPTRFKVRLANGRVDVAISLIDNVAYIIIDKYDKKEIGGENIDEVLEKIVLHLNIMKNMGRI